MLESTVVSTFRYLLPIPDEKGRTRDSVIGRRVAARLPRVVVAGRAEKAKKALSGVSALWQIDCHPFSFVYAAARSIAASQIFLHKHNSTYQKHEQIRSVSTIGLFDRSVPALSRTVEDLAGKPLLDLARLGEWLLVKLLRIRPSCAARSRTIL